MFAKVRLSSKQWLLLGFGLLLALLLVVAIRFVALKDDSVHFHANFAVYIHGQRQEFKSFTFYEEVQACSAEGDDNPKHRVHMHDQVNHLVHVHDHAVTWGHFFANLGYNLGDSAIETDDGVFADGQGGNALTFTLNSEPVESAANRLIKSEDVLLINYGKDNEATLTQRYNDIPHDAQEANSQSDPASCKGSQALTPATRLKAALKFWE